jgi:hypothetical protein
MDETPVTIADGEIAHLQKLHQARYDAIKATIPAGPWSCLTKAQRQIVEGYIASAVASYGRRRLACVVWPWTPRPGIETRAPRGCLSNPTALR